MVKPTVDLAVDDETLEQEVEVVFGVKRFSLDKGTAAQLMSDLGSVLAYAYAHEGEQIPSQRDGDEDEIEEDEEPEQDADTDVDGPPLKWNRVTGQSKYKTNLNGKQVVVLRERKGWNVKFAGRRQPENPIPFARKGDAQDFVEQQLRQQQATSR